MAASASKVGTGVCSILQGDFNDDPSSSVYTLASSTFDSVYGPQGAGTASGCCTRPRARLARAHVCWRFPESEPKFTTWKYRSDADGRPKDSCHVIDYIFHSAGLRPVQLWGIPTAEEIGAGALPCSRYPSDHVSLAAVFRYA